MKAALSIPTLVCSALTLTIVSLPLTLAAQSPLPLLYSSSSTSLFDTFTPTQPALPTAPLPQHPPKRQAETSISLGSFAQFTDARLHSDAQDFYTQSNSPSAGVLGTFRQSFSNWLGYSVNLGYDRTATHYTHNPTLNSVTNPSNFAVPANVYETSLSWLGQKAVNRNLTFFTEAGAGVLTYLPVHRGADAILYAPDQLRTLVPSVNFRPLAVGGFGFNYRLTPHLGFRAEYRAQIYKLPDYGFGVPKLTTVSSQPTLSLTYTFHPKKK